jgi:hypothetical protein
MAGASPATDATASFVGVTDNDNAGQDVSCAGDVDGDGMPDLLIGAEGATDVVEPLVTGGAYLFYGPA